MRVNYVRIRTAVFWGVAPCNLIVVSGEPPATIFKVSCLFLQGGCKKFSFYCAQVADSRSLSNVCSHLQDCRVISSDIIPEEITMYSDTSANE